VWKERKEKSLSSPGPTHTGENGRQVAFRRSSGPYSWKTKSWKSGRAFEVALSATGYRGLPRSAPVLGAFSWPTTAQGHPYAEKLPPPPLDEAMNMIFGLGGRPISARQAWPASANSGRNSRTVPAKPGWPVGPLGLTNPASVGPLDGRASFSCGSSSGQSAENVRHRLDHHISLNDKQILAWTMPYFRTLVTLAAYTLMQHTKKTIMKSGNGVWTRGTLRMPVVHVWPGARFVWRVFLDALLAEKRKKRTDAGPDISVVESAPNISYRQSKREGSDLELMPFSLEGAGTGPAGLMPRWDRIPEKAHRGDLLVCAVHP